MIEDRPELIAPALERLQGFVATNANRKLEWRVRMLMTLKRALTESLGEICAAAEKDLNRNPFLHEQFNVVPSCLEIDETIAALPGWMHDDERDTPVMYGPGKSRIVYEPLGVCLVMPAWNFPFATLFNPMISALAAGNACLVKPSEMAAHSSRVIKTMLDKYFEPEHVACIEGGVNTSIAITQAPVDVIIFTGSPAKGKLVAKAAAQNLVPCILELGGKSPTVIDSSANVRLAARKMAFTKFLNCGQICVTTDYAMVHETVYEDFLKEFKAATTEFYGESGSTRGNQDMGKIINRFHTERLAALLADKHGGEVAMGGKVHLADDFIEPTVVLNPSHESKMMQDEIFGPILPVYKFREIEEVIRFIRAREKPLTMYYFGKVLSNPAKERFIHEVSSGSIAVNEFMMQIMNPHLPFGGVGNSGYGKYHGIEGFKHLSNAKSVLVKPALDFKPFNDIVPPFGPAKQRQLKPMAKLLGMKTQATMVRGIFVFAIVVSVLLLLATGTLQGLACRSANFAGLVADAFHQAFLH